MSLSADAIIERIEALVLQAVADTGGTPVTDTTSWISPECDEMMSELEKDIKEALRGLAE